MKLYATVTSERATKGQGGEMLAITLYDGEKKPAALITMFKEGGEVRPAVHLYHTLRVQTPIVIFRAGVDLQEEVKRAEANLKGEKKKGEMVLDACWCGSRTVHTHQ